MRMDNLHNELRCTVDWFVTHDARNECGRASNLRMAIVVESSEWVERPEVMVVADWVDLRVVAMDVHHSIEDDCNLRWFVSFRAPCRT